MSFTSRLIVAIAAAERDGYIHFAAGLRELLRREQGASVVTVEPSIARDRCESPQDWLTQYRPKFPSKCGDPSLDAREIAEFDRRDKSVGCNL